MRETVAVETFDTYAQNFASNHLIPGAIVGIRENRQMVYEKSFGFRHVEKQLEVTSDTIFGIASMTKSFTCAGIMKLQEEGRLSVHDPIVTFLPELKAKGKEQMEQITIHHLMTHTAGFPPLPTHVYARKRSIEQDPSAKDYGLDLLNNPGPHIETYEEMLNYMAKIDFEWLGSLGDYYSYSNDSYGLLGVIISRVSGKSYEEYIHQNILKPAGMNNSFYELRHLDESEDVATLYMKAKDGSHVYEAPLWWDAPSMRAVGYLKSTANEILRYLELYWNAGIVDGNRILSKESVDQMIYPHVEYEPGKCYGYGLRVTPDYFGSTMISHGGGLKGVSSYMCAIPDKKMAGVILTNVSDVPSADLLMGAMNVIEHRKQDATPITYEFQEVFEKELQKFEGVYVSGEGMNVKVARQGNQLSIESNGRFRSLQCIGPHVFIDAEENEPDVLQFIENHQGEIERIVYGGRHIMKVNS